MNDDMYNPNRNAWEENMAFIEGQCNMTEEERKEFFRSKLSMRAEQYQALDKITSALGNLSEREKWIFCAGVLTGLNAH